MKIEDLFEGKKKELTLEQFRAKKKRSTFRKSPTVEGGVIDDAELDQAIFVYPGETYIIIQSEKPAKYSLIIANDEQVSSDLEALEQRLYWEFYAQEIADSKAIPRGQPTEPADWEEYVSN